MMTSKKLHICIIDDDRIYQFAARKTIERTGLAETISPFINGEEAINYLKKRIADQTSLPDYIFLDINMPVMNGWQFLEEYQAIPEKNRSQSKIFMVSSSVSDYDINRSKEFEVVSGYIIKPVPTEKFREILSSDFG